MYDDWMDLVPDTIRIIPSKCRVLKFRKNRTGCLKMECAVHDNLEKGYVIKGYHVGLFHQYVIMVKDA